MKLLRYHCVQRCEPTIINSHHHNALPMLTSLHRQSGLGRRFGNSLLLSSYEGSFSASTRRKKCTVGWNEWMEKIEDFCECAYIFFLFLQRTHSAALRSSCYFSKSSAAAAQLVCWPISEVSGNFRFSRTKTSTSFSIHNPQRDFWESLDSARRRQLDSSVSRKLDLK